MTIQELQELLDALRKLTSETEWVEFKHNNADPQMIGEYLSALSNSAGLHRKEAGYIVWGIEDKTHNVVGTTFRPKQAKIGNYELENWLSTQLSPRINFRIFELTYEDASVVVFEVQPCQHTPVRWKDIGYIRVGSYKKELKDHPEKERALWLLTSKTIFEKEMAWRDVNGDQALTLLNYPSFFELIKMNLPNNKRGILERLATEKIIQRKGADKFDITNLGALLFAKTLKEFDGLGRKAVRVILYEGNNRVKTIKEHLSEEGYAAGFKALVAYINDQLPRNEQMGQALRQEVRMYPEIAIRELVANAIIHQDLTFTGDSPLVEIFSDRVEITNSGRPLIDTLRFIDEPPQSRNEVMAGLMRRLYICEERGTGIDKVIFNIQLHQLPAPKFLVTENHTKVILYAYKKLSDMDGEDKTRACYQHACLQFVSNQNMTNASLRQRFSIDDKNYSIASRIIADTMEAGLIKPYDPDSTSKKYASYVPFWVT